MERLPVECLLSIFQWLPLHQKLLLERVCRTWRSLLLRPASHSATLSADFGELLPNCCSQEAFEAAVEGVLRRSGIHIRCLSFGARWFRISRKVVDSVEQTCTRLHHLDLSASIIDADLGPFIASRGRHLVAMSLEDSSWTNTEDTLGMTEMFEKFQALRSLNLRGVPSPKGLGGLPSSLRCVDLSAVQSLSSKDLSDFLRAHENLVDLRLNPLPVGSVDVVEAIGDLRLLETLDFGCASAPTPPSALPLTAFARLSHLRTLRIAFCNSLDSSSLRILSASLKNLHVLEIKKCPLVDDFSSLRNFSNLRTLALSDADIRDANLVDVAYHKTLRHLTVSGCPGVSSLSIKTLIRECPLVELHLEKCENIGDETPKTLAASALPMTSISLKGCTAITSTGVGSIALMKHLDKIQELDLSDNWNVDDTALIRIYTSLWLRMTPRAEKVLRSWWVRCEYRI
ncbi:hypothetical protein QR680_005652 [Steinernema hermaphroditum]|uniref:F-box domain-containing protein n=1 Tax=Steinernema hermaphroditum TaxID=289476 RepID=A0AA39HTY8_9BILA|nr:hypothetical protein QR680_005652 [Steinernema hermaphroditum]